jgi:toxin ParE1/3/4
VAGKRVLRRAAADADIETIIDHYLAVAGREAALRFVDALESALLHLSRHPSTGSPKYAIELNMPGLRSWPLSRFRYLVFYVDKPQELDVWRVLHDMLDLPEWPEGHGAP